MKSFTCFLVALFAVIGSSVFAAVDAKPLVFFESVSNKSDNKSANMESFPAAVMDRIINTRKFDVCRSLDDLKKLLKERTATGKRAEAYLIRMTVIQYSHIDKIEKLGLKRVAQAKAIIVAQIEYADAVTGKILESKRAQTEKSSSDELYGKVERFDDSLKKQAMEQAVQDISDQCANRFIEMVYPVKLLRISGNSVYVNAGQDRVSPNECFNVYKLGEEFVDPDTGENLGADEEYVARVKIVQAKQKYSIGSVVDGAIKGKSKDYILRKCSTEQIADPEAEKTAENPADSDPHGAVPF